MKPALRSFRTSQLPNLILLLFVVVLFFLYVFRPWYLAWGASPAEIRAQLPGDDLVPNPKMITTRAVTIKAPPDKVWPWLVQVGYKRAGWYNLDWVNRILGVADYADGHRSANRIIPEFQRLLPGDVVLLAPNVGWTVTSLKPRRSLVFLARVDFQTGQTFQAEGPWPKRYLNSSQTFILRQVDRNTTRLIVRDRLDFSAGRADAVTWALEPGFFIQESTFMLGVKKRAEGAARL